MAAVRTWAKMVEDGTEELIFCIVDAHAITVPYAATLPQRTLRLAGDLIASGVDPEKSILFVQSDVKEHTELAWYLAAVTPMGDLGRMTQFKEKSANADGDFVPVAKVLFENFDRELVPVRKKRESLDDETIKSPLLAGAEKAREIAKKTMIEVRKVMGLGAAP
ncbi:MAG: hypothetical protein ABI461_05600 [Polyangiaceae bacterium]